MPGHSSSLTLASTVMLPAQQPLRPTAKRKASEDMNPLLAAAAKKSKKDHVKAQSNKRKLLNGEEQPSGLLIVRAPPSSQDRSAPNGLATTQTKPPPRPSSAQAHRIPSSSSSGAGPSQQPTKKFRAGSVPLQSNPRIRDKRDYAASIAEDPNVEEAVRAMDDEADHLRRQSRAHSSHIDPGIQFPPSTPANGNRRGKNRADTLVAVPDRETPQLEKNKSLRDNAMAQWTANNTPSQRTSSLPPSGSSSGHRRKSSISSRGKRISGMFEATGIISQPHNSVSESSFYKHIDCDLAEPERVRQLLIWCSSRAAASYMSPLSSSHPSSSKAPPPQLPLLSTKAASALKTVQDDLVRMLAERKLPIRLYYSPAERDAEAEGKKKENEQNVKNRQWEQTYSGQIQRAQQEAEKWNQVDAFYDAYLKKCASREPSAKAKGKQRATDPSDPDGSLCDDDWDIREYALPKVLQPGLDLAKAVLGRTRPQSGEDRVVGSSSMQSALLAEERAQKEADIQRRESELELAADKLLTFLNTARKTTNIAETVLDQRFELLSLGLMPPSTPTTLPSGAAQTHLLTKYVPRGVDRGLQSSSSREGNPHELLRALANVDRERPPSQKGDAAWRAVREVQRAGESGVGDRRVTGVPPMPQTPRKAPGTPRRGNTPGRATTPGRGERHDR
ncbi:hypothetical protein HGRIS_004563 [Hohenbuehelia grisea]|uniref:Uncharacterized protein n=1 Tax=Hohenbuehelia grisea TaxID=104357 RepID=A0ABR3JCM2_9AGAR